MTFNEVSAIFKAKYTNGSISISNDNTILVCFNANSKCYEYVKISYVSLLAKLSCDNYIYEHNYKNVCDRIAELENDIKIGGYNDVFTDEFVLYNTQELYNLNVELNHQKSLINNKIIVK